MDSNTENSLYMDLALRIAEESYSTRTKVGCVIVKDNNVLSTGWNGMPSGMPNCCEDEHGVTKVEVLHAELNALAKVAKSTQSCEGAKIYITMSPCIDCSKMLASVGIKEVYYRKQYRITEGIEFLENLNIPVTQMES